MSGTALEGLMDETPEQPETVAPAPSPEPSPAPAPEPAAATPPVQVTETPVQQPAATQAQDGRYVPLAVVLDERDKRRAVEAEAAELRAWRAEQERKRQEAQAQFPNILDDPDGYHARMMEEITGIRREAQSQVHGAVMQERMANSEDKWRDKLDDQDWGKLNQWISSSWDKGTHALAMKQRDPYGWAWAQLQGIERSERARKLEGELGGKDLATFLAEKEAEWQSRQTPVTTPQIQTPSPHPASSQPRAPDGKFASPSEPQRHEPVSLTAVPAASSSRNGSDKSGLTLTGLIDS